MKILYIITKSSEGGAQTHISQLAKYMINHGHEVAVMSAPGGWLEQEIKTIGGTFFAMQSFKNSYNPFLVFSLQKKIFKIARAYNPDLVSCHSGFAGMVGRLAIKNRILTLFTAHGWSFAPGAPILQRIVSIVVEKYCARFTKKIICVSEYDRQLAVRFGISSQEKLVTIHNGVEIPSVPPPQKTHLQDIIFVGRLVNQKNPLALLQALMRIPKAIRQKLSVRFVGSGYLKKELVGFCDANGLNTIVTWYGGIPRSEVLALVKKSDLFVLPTNYEGLPRSILEAMSVGTPVLATGVGGIAELVNNHIGRVLTKGDEAEELSEEIQSLFTHPDLLREKGEAAYMRVKDSFALESMLLKTYTVYESCINA